MTDERRTGPAARALRWGQVLLVLIAGAAALLAAMSLMGRQLVLDGAFMCGPQVSEGTMIAPSSWRARVLCAGDEVGVPAAVALVVPAVLCAVAAPLLWLRTGRRRLVLTALVLTVLVPTVLLGVVRVVPADCTGGQQERYGAAGCERDIESR